VRNIKYKVELYANLYINIGTLKCFSLRSFLENEMQCLSDNIITFKVDIFLVDELLIGAEVASFFGKWVSNNRLIYTYL